MLSEQEKREIHELVRHAEYKQAAVPDALKVVQRHRRWISDQTLADVAAALEMTPAQVDAVATFYNQIFRSPVGRHVIQICDSVSCWATGYNAVRAHIEKHLGIVLGQTTADGRFTLIPCACLGVCEQAPAMLVDEDVHGNLTPEKIEAVLQQYE